jgi:hypothetical protein
MAEPPAAPGARALRDRAIDTDGVSNLERPPGPSPNWPEANEALHTKLLELRNRIEPISKGKDNATSEEAIPTERTTDTPSHMQNRKTALSQTDPPERGQALTTMAFKTENTTESSIIPTREVRNHGEFCQNTEPPKG